MKLLIIICVFLCISCNNNRNNNSFQNDSIRQNIYGITQTLSETENIKPFAFTGDKPISIEIPKNYTDPLFPSQLIESHRYIPLETNEHSLFGDIEKIIIRNGKIFISDNFKSSVFIFNINGKFENKINNAGNGPYEYYR